MGKLFNCINTYMNLNEWIPVFDWLFDDTKFNGWDKQNKKAKLTKAMKRIDSFPTEERYQTGTASSLSFPQKAQKTIMVFQYSGSESEELIRHIRNAIAHGTAEIKPYKSGLYLLARDYGRSSKKGDPSGQTAFILIPANFLFEIFSAYCRIKKNTRH